MENMTTFDYTVKDELGIHARPAGLLVKEAKNFTSKITIKKGEKEVDATRVMAVMALGVKQGETVTVNVGPSYTSRSCGSQHFRPEQSSSSYMCCTVCCPCIRSIHNVRR